MNGMCITRALLCSGMLLAASAFAAETPPPAKHPNFLLNRDEIEQIKLRIAQQPWAAVLFQQAKDMADKGDMFQAALCFALTGEKRYGDFARGKVLENTRYHLIQYQKEDVRLQPDRYQLGPWGLWAWAYDLTYDGYSEEQRQSIENALRTIGKTVIELAKLNTTTPNLVFDMHYNVALVGYCLGDRELIDWGLNDPGDYGPQRGGFYPVLDSIIKDGHFWGEAPIYALHYDVLGMVALAEAARHYNGTDLYGYVSKKTGASIKNIIDGYFLMAYPVEKTGVNAGSVRMATFGDGSTWFAPSGELLDTFLVNPVTGDFSTVGQIGELEAAYAHYKDPGYAWLLSLNPNRNVLSVYGRSPWKFIALTHGVELPKNPTPPPAPCGVYPSQGFAVLRSDETPAYWTSGALTAVMRLGAAIGHGHEDYYSIVLHGKGRLLYPDLNVIQYEPTCLGWTREGIAHSTLLVDGQSPRAGEFTTRNDFTPDAKFLAASGSAFPGTTQTRALLLTRDYMVDVFRAAANDGRERTFDWVLHGLGRLYPGNPAAYRPGTDLVANYWWIDNERSRTVDAAWQADFVQHSGGVTPGLQAFSKEWFEQTAGVRVTMLGAPGTEVFCGDGPMADGPPHHRIDGNPEGALPLVIARRKGIVETFVAVHEPYDQWPVLTVRTVADTGGSVGIAVDGPAFSDRVLVAFDLAPEEYHVANEDGEVFIFRDCGYLRVAGGQITARGKLLAFRVRVQQAGDVSLVLNGKKEKAGRDGEFIVFGKLPLGNAPKTRTLPDPPAERQAFLHYYWMPEEIHLAKGSEKQVQLHVRCVGRGETGGRLVLATPNGITVTPDAIDLPAMADGEERTVPLRVNAAAEAANDLHSIKIEPAAGTPAAPATLLASVGVVMTENRLRPRLAEWVIRAPGYTMGVDEFSGNSYYLLDADGHRRFGRLHNTNFIFGFPGIMRDGKWALAHRHPCQFVWHRKNVLEIGCGGLYNDHDIRLLYTFYEDRIVMNLKPPTRPDLEHTIWLGNFDILGPPRNGTMETTQGQPPVDWYFYPHPAHRQGVLLTVPNKAKVNYYGSAVSFNLRLAQEVTLKFVTPEEAPAQ